MKKKHHTMRCDGVETAQQNRHCGRKVQKLHGTEEEDEDKSK